MFSGCDQGAYPMITGTAAIRQRNRYSLKLSSGNILVYGSCSVVDSNLVSGELVTFVGYLREGYVHVQTAKRWRQEVKDWDSWFFLILTNKYSMTIPSPIYSLRQLIFLTRSFRELIFSLNGYCKISFKVKATDMLRFQQQRLIRYPGTPLLPHLLSLHLLPNVASQQSVLLH